MAVYVIAYDLNKETVRPKIVDEIKNTAWAKLSESSYAVDTSETAQQVYDRMFKFLDENDNLYVIPLRKPYAGWGPKAVVEWLNKRLQY